MSGQWFARGAHVQHRQLKDCPYNISQKRWVLNQVRLSRFLGRMRNTPYRLLQRHPKAIGMMSLTLFLKHLPIILTLIIAPPPGVNFFHGKYWPRWSLTHSIKGKIQVFYQAGEMPSHIVEFEPAVGTELHLSVVLDWQKPCRLSNGPFGTTLSYWWCNGSRQSRPKSAYRRRGATSTTWCDGTSSGSSDNCITFADAKFTLLTENHYPNRRVLSSSLDPWNNVKKSPSSSISSKHPSKVAPSKRCHDQMTKTYPTKPSPEEKSPSVRSKLDQSNGFVDVKGGNLKNEDQLPLIKSRMETSTHPNWPNQTSNCSYTKR